MKNLLALTYLVAAGSACADIEVISDQVEPTNLSFPKAELRRYLAAHDYYGRFPKGFFHRGLGMPAPGSFDLELGGAAKTLSFDYVVENESGMAAVTVSVWGDGKELWTSPVKRSGETKSSAELVVGGVKTLTVKVEPAEGLGKCRHVCLGNIRIVYPDGARRPGDICETTRQLGVLTPPSAAVPRVNGARVYGVRPARPIVFRVPATGAAPLDVRVEGLEKAPGRAYDPATRILSGRIAERGDYRLTIVATNAFGCDRKPFAVKVGDTIALTPPMGWNSWNAFGPEVSAEKVAAAAEAMISSGLADHGWSFVNIDDYWENNPSRAKDDPSLAGPERLADGTIATNARFPDMKGLVDGIHARGLRAGLYSSPGPYTCGRCVGSFGHEEHDAKTYARWGFDYLKYDWCTCKVMKGDPEGYTLPFLKMGLALRALDRDIVYSFNSGLGKRLPSLWGRFVYANCWRISGDVFDTWTSVSAAISLSKRLYAYSAPGAWNDPDMLCIGPVRYNDFRPSRLSPNEQYTHISMWALLAAPLMIGCDMTKMDELTLSLLTNDEVIEIDQDELGAAAGCIAEGDDWEIWARPLAGGDVAVGLYNKSKRAQTIVFDMEKAGLLCKWRVRDCWRQEDVGVFLGSYSSEVPGHATELLRFSPKTCGHLREGLTDVRDAAGLLLYTKGMLR